MLWSSDMGSDEEIAHNLHGSSALTEEEEEDEDLVPECCAAGKYLGGPYDVEITKPYKPLFIIFCDLLISISYFAVLVSVVYNKIDYITLYSEFLGLLPEYVWLLMVMFIIKNFAGITYSICKARGGLNKSSKTYGLFMFRVFYDIFGVWAIIIH